MMENYLLNQISTDEYAMLTKYRDYYAWYEDDDSTGYHRRVDIKTILNEDWARSKQTLFKLLGNNLIITKSFNYEKTVDELVHDLHNMIDGEYEYGRSNRQGYKFIENFCLWLRDTYHIPSSHWDSLKCAYVYDTEEDEKIAETNKRMRQCCNDLISYYALANNKYEGEPFTIELKDGKSYKISTGCKPMKAIAKIANSFNIEGFEDFRICHSLIHNQKRLEGEITLSIHPLDYWTMSDNQCGWDSCMSWQEPGSYRQGTVEMMNSPSVVVAYINAKEPMLIDNKPWSNKKWRQLFIVDRDVILGIKSYPYYNEELSRTIVDWLKELAETNMGWKYVGDEPLSYNCEPISIPNCIDNNLKIKFSFHSNFMYTDVGCCDNHPMYIGEKVYEENQDKIYNNCIQILYNYSGSSQCMCCGTLTNDFDGEGYVCCCECETATRCYECGDRLYSDDYYVINGYTICENCYNDVASICAVSDESDFKDNMENILIAVPTPKDFDYHSIDSYYRASLENNENKPLVAFYSPIYVSYNNLATFQTRCLREGAKIHHYKTTYGSIKAVFLDDLLLDTIEWENYMPWQFYDIAEEAQNKKDYKDFINFFNFHLRVHTVHEVESKL